MAATYNPAAPSPPWTRIFIEIAARAIRRVHHDYLLFATHQAWDTPADLTQFNDNPGLAFADEPTVCAAISQEFLNSRLASGSWVDAVPTMIAAVPANPAGATSPAAPIAPTIAAGRRYYVIEREKLYSDGVHEVDFCVNRIDETTGDAMGRPSFIEAKRAFVRTTRFGPIAQLLQQSRPRSMQTFGSTSTN